MKVLVLGGTGEARELADRLRDHPQIRVVTSLAGRTARPRIPGGEVRIGGFGGVDGLVGWLRSELVDAVVDATHPFASRITANAAAACVRLRLPLLIYRRPGWRAQDGDDWQRVESLDAAADRVPPGARVFLTVGRTGIAPFAGLEQPWFLARCVEPPQPPTPPRLELLLARGPFALADELALLHEHRINLLVTKDSGSAATAAKLDAARLAGIPVLMVDRPPLPPNARVVGTEPEVIRWLEHLLPQ